MKRTIEEINEKLKKGEAVVLTAEEIIQLRKERGKEATQKVDVVTCATFGPMCSSGALLNIGHTKPRIKIGGGRCYLNDVPAYTGLAAVDIYIGATALPDDDPRNRFYPGRFPYGGGHVIEELVAGKYIKLKATAYGTDCYPRKELETYISLAELNEALLLNPRNAYQNYNVAVNTSDKTIYTYMGVLLPRMQNATFCSAGQLSPLLKDPFYKVIGIGTKIFLGGGIGFVYWWGTQHNPEVERTKNGVPKVPAGTIAVCGDMKQMSPEFLKGVSFYGYGVSLAVGIGVAIPILDEEVLEGVLIDEENILAPIVDYAKAYPEREPEILGYISYAELRRGEIDFGGKKIKTGCLSSYRKALQICDILKEWLLSGRFTLTCAVEKLPSVGSGYRFKPLQIKERVE